MTSEHVWSAPTQSTGPLSGTRVVVLGGIGPVPFAAMLLADMGADVIRADREAEAGKTPLDAVCRRGQRGLFVDLKDQADRARMRELIGSADVLLEGFRPGVAEKLGFGPSDCAARNPGLVYGRMTGWGQDGPLAQRAGHDIGYIAISGALASLGAAGSPPRPPLNLVGDFGGGAMFLVTGVLAALLERQSSGRGQVVDAAMMDGVGVLMTPMQGMLSTGDWVDGRDTNFSDGSTPFYRCYEAIDGHMAVGAFETQFYAELLAGLGIDDLDVADQWKTEQWPQVTQRFTEMFAGRTRAEWAEVFDRHDACVVPVLTLVEARQHPQALARDAYAEIDGLAQAAPAPRFSRTPPPWPQSWARPGQHTAAIRDALDTTRESKETTGNPQLEEESTK